MSLDFATSPGCTYTDPCAGTPEDPLGPAACAHPQQLACGNEAPYPLLSTAHGCTCKPTAPLVPTDCPQTTQFNCTDWTSPCGCWCDPDAPDAAAACVASAPDPAMPWACHSYDPPVRVRVPHRSAADPLMAPPRSRTILPARDEVIEALDGETRERIGREWLRRADVELTAATFTAQLVRGLLLDGAAPEVLELAGRAVADENRPRTAVP